jgi:RNA polymerase sigma-70 factor, ECF subfamily
MSSQPLTFQPQPALTPPSPTAAEDALTLHRVALRQEPALREIYLKYGPGLLGGAYRALGSMEDANEVLQDWLVKVWERAATYDAQLSSAPTWLTMICRGLVSNKLRSRRRRPISSLTDATEALDAVTAATDDVGPAALEAIFGQFSPEERLYLDAAVFSPLTHEEIAESLSQPLGTVKTRIRKALDKLKNLIREEL